MATLVLRAAGAAIGTALGGPLGGLIGGALGAVGGAVVDSRLINALAPRRSAPQVDTLAVTNSAENSVLHKLWGRMRLGGNVIWCAQFKTYNTKQSTGSGKGGVLSPKTTVTHYTLSFAVAFCEAQGDVSLGRVWADGNLLDLSQVAVAFYDGSETQGPDGFIESIEGVGSVPAYRGTCYLVFQDLLLDPFGNRMPQITAEIVRRPVTGDPDDLGTQLKAVCLLPGAGEFALGTLAYKSSDGFGNWFPENLHQQHYDVAGQPDPTDFEGSMSELAAALPGRQAVSLVVSWFGTDLRAGACRIVPKVETRSKLVIPRDWTVAGQVRASAELVSQIAPAAADPGETDVTSGTVPASGGTPSDDTVVQAIQALNGQGVRVLFYPFVMMDVPPGNGLPDPYGGAEQAVFPWRGRITCHPAPGQPGTVDQTAAAAVQVNAFFAQYTPMVLHYAQLAVQAGGVDAFAIGSELVGLTRVRSGPGDAAYPAVAALKSLAAAVKAVVGPRCRVGYAADWSEYHSHRPADGTGDVLFNMDPLWSDPNLDFIGIDNYLPLSDWRDGAPNLDGQGDGAPVTVHDKAYLSANVEGGEDYDWYYASDAARAAQVRTPIVDTAYGEPWVFRQKDIRNWWLGAHRNRPGGVRETSATAFVPGGKPVWFTEFGCPAVDKGSNQPNVFFDPKSSESALPYFSLGSRDDAIQRAALETVLSYWRDHAPASPATGAPMVEAANMFAWAWDARPYPDFPGLSAVWRDAPNYELGHWLTGRLDQVPVATVVAELCAAVGVTAFDVSRLAGASALVAGYATDALASPRDILAALMDAYGFDACESGGFLVFFARGGGRPVVLGADDLAVDGDADPGYSLVRAPETDLPGALRLSFADPFRAYATGTVEARKPNGTSQAVSTVSTGAVLDEAYALQVATSLLQQSWTARETATVKLPPSQVALDPGDVVSLGVDGVVLPFRVKQVTTSTYRQLDLVGFDPSLLRVAVTPQASTSTGVVPVAVGPPVFEVMDLPLVTGAEAQPWAPRLAAYANPWVGVDVYRGNAGGGFDFVVTIESPAVMGELTAPLYRGPVDRWDGGNTVSVRFYAPAGLLSLPDTQVLAGANALAVKNPTSGQWEVVQFATAGLTGNNSYALTRLLRGQLGTEGAIDDPVPAGARVVVLDPDVLAILTEPIDNRALLQTLRYGPATAPVSDPDFTTLAVQAQGVGLRPWSVGGIAGWRDPVTGDVRVTWARRTRFGGDAWDPDVVPLNEENEAYVLDVLRPDGSSTRGVTGLGAPAWTYAAADQVSDFGALQTSYAIRVAQVSALFGPGQAATTTVFP